MTNDREGNADVDATRQAIDAAPYRKRWHELDRLAERWKPLWREVNEYVLPWSGRFLYSDRDRQEVRRGQNVHNSVTYNAIQTAASGLHGGLTSPSRPWFELAHPDEQLMENARVKMWIHQVQNSQRLMLAKSNFYSAVQDLYYEALAYGQGVTLMERDLGGGCVRFRTLTCGEYRLANGADLRIDSVYRRLMLTAAQMRTVFKDSRLPKKVEEALGRGDRDRVFYLIQAIQPWGFFDNSSSDRWKFESVYFLEDGGREEAVITRRGYSTRPFVAVRWGQIGDEVYGHSPGQMALADIRQLQTQERAYVNAVNWIADPAWLVSDSLKDHLARGEIRPGAIIGASPQDAQHLFRPLLRPLFDFANIRLKIQDVEERIRMAFYNPLFLMVQSRQGQMTATEVMQLVDEKASVLGPVLERFQAELFDPVLARLFDIMAGELAMMPAAPPEMVNQALKVEYVSLLAQAQKQAGLTGMTHFLAVSGEIIRNFPEAAAKINPEEAIDQMAVIYNAPAPVVRSDDEVAGIREKAAAQQVQEAQLATIERGADIAKTLGATSMGNGNALDALVESPTRMQGSMVDMGDISHNPPG